MEDVEGVERFAGWDGGRDGDVIEDRHGTGVLCYGVQ